MIKRWENDRNIPLLTKYKVMLNGAGIAPVGLVVPDAVRIERETTEGKDRYVVRTYTKTDGEYEYELLSENEFNDKRIAEASVSQQLDALWDAKVGEVVSNLDVREKGMLSTKLQELPNKKEVLDAYLLVPELRNAKEKQLAQKVYDAVDEVTGIGRTAYESKLMDDSFGTDKLHLKKREISPKKEEVVQTIPSEEKVAEMPTTEVKKEQPNEDITTSIIVAPYYDTKVNTIEEAKILRESEGYKQHKEKLISVAETLGLKEKMYQKTLGSLKTRKAIRLLKYLIP